MTELSDYDRETLDRIARSCVNGEDDIEARVRAVMVARDNAQAALRRAADEIHAEARWQLECSERGISPLRAGETHIDRLLMTERIVRSLGADSSAVSS